VSRGLDPSSLGSLGPWIGLVLAGILAAAVTIGLSSAMRRGLGHATASEAAAEP
jgi:hypothetical protein